MTIERSVRTPIMNRVVAANGFVFLGGTTADDKSLGMKDQTKQILGKIDGLLAQGGTDKTKLVTATIYMADLSQKAEMNEAWTAWLAPDELPARVTVGVAELGKGTLLEIVVTASQG